RVTGNGSVLDSAGIQITSGLLDETVPSVAFNGTNYLIVWQRGNENQNADICAARISPEGILLDTNALVVSAAVYDQKTPAAAALGGDYFVVWDDRRNSATRLADLYGARIAGDGTLLDSSGIPICTAPG